MNRIRVLEPAVVDRIAAGEVVERPASVVKELVENALDADATRVEVRVEGGGRELIEVVDDGHGMSPGDAALAFTQHATSKIADVADLDRIRTLGFRGEALASIGSVARVELITGTGEGPGARIEVEGAGEPRRRETASPRGTRVRVRDLFYNTPARRKHLRTDATEMRHVAAVMEQFALLRPDVHVELTAAGRERLTATPVATLAERVHQVLGAEVADAWIELGDAGGRIRVRGGVTAPEVDRGNRRQVYLFVNGRAVDDGRLAHAVRAAYDTLLDKGRHPVAALFVELAVEDVDVNVHPRKAEVRFVEPGRVYGAIRGTVQRALARHLPPPVLQARSADRPVQGAAPAYLPREGEGGDDGRGEKGPAHGGLPIREWRVMEGTGAGSVPEAPVRSSPLVGEGVGDAAIAGTHGEIVPLAQYGNTYILAADAEGLLIIDQHVAHERVLFEQVLRRQEEGDLEVQRLLVPETLELSAAEAESAAEHAELLTRFGFEVEPFGGDTWALRTVPRELADRRPGRVVRALLGSLGDDLGPDALDEARRAVAASIACHAAIRANEPLNHEVMAWLVEELGRCEAPNRCPHGRPILLRVEHGEIERRLGRR